MKKKREINGVAGLRNLSWLTPQSGPANMFEIRPCKECSRINKYAHMKL